MKTTAVLVAVAATVALPSAAEECKTSDLVLKLLPLLSDSNYKQCQTDSGYTFYPFTGLPSDAQFTKLCASTACHKLLTRVQALNLPSCDITYQNVTYNLHDTVDTIATRCPSTL